ncbi:hypothetical protein CYMTET_26348, partial [Cymbomonas tetramitiformis]
MRQRDRAFNERYCVYRLYDSLLEWSPWMVVSLALSILLFGSVVILSDRSPLLAQQRQLRQRAWIPPRSLSCERLDGDEKGFVCKPREHTANTTQIYAAESAASAWTPSSTTMAQEMAPLTHGNLAAALAQSGIAVTREKMEQLSIALQQGATQATETKTSGAVLNGSFMSEASTEDNVSDKHSEESGLSGKAGRD